MAAETALESSRQEVAELRTELSDRSGLVPDRWTRDESEKIANDLNQQIKTLQEQKNTVEERLIQVREEANQRIRSLEKECRQAKTKALQIERDSRFEAEVLAEVSRLQSEHANFNSGSVGEGDPAENLPAIGAKEESQKVLQLYEENQRQRQAIEEERAMYQALLADHEDCLALLAHHEITRTCTIDALLRHGGQKAVDAANSEAEEKSIASFGKYISFE